MKRQKLSSSVKKSADPMKKASNSQSRVIERITCPVVKVPGSIHKKRDRGDMGWDKEAKDMSSISDRNSFDPEKKQRIAERETRQAEKEEFMKALQSIKDLSATSYKGLSKKKYKEDKLTALGAPRVKEQTMPFKMKMGILDARKRREARKLVEMKESGQVILQSKKNIREGKRSNSGGGLDVRTFKGVLYLGKNSGPRSDNFNSRTTRTPHR